MIQQLKLIFGADQEKVIDYLLNNEQIKSHVVTFDKENKSDKTICYTIFFYSTEGAYLFGYMQASMGNDFNKIIKIATS